MSTNIEKLRTYHVGADIIRILACIGVIVIHVTDPFLTYPPYFGIGGSSWWITNVINTFFRVSVPLFIILSGYLLLDTSRTLDIKSFYKRRFARIGIPTLFWIVFYFAWKYSLGEIKSIGDIIHRLLTGNLDHLYFLIIILELYLITPLLIFCLSNLKRNGYYLLIIGALILTSGNALINQLYPKEAVVLQKGLLTMFIPYLFYYLIGPVFKNIKISLSSMISLGLIYFYAIIFVSIVSGGIVGSYFRQAGSITIILLTVISFCILIQLNRVTYLLNGKYIKKSIQHVSTLVFGAYLVHMMMISLTDMKINLIPGNIASPIWIFVLIKVVIVIFASFTITAIGKKIPFLRFIFV